MTESYLFFLQRIDLNIHYSISMMDLKKKMNEPNLLKDSVETDDDNLEVL